MAWGRKAVSGSVSGGRGGLDPALLPCLSGGRGGGVSNQTLRQDCVLQARPHLLSWTCPLCFPPSFLADSEGHTLWGDSGGGGFVFASCLQDVPGSPLCCAPTPISSPFLVATLGLRASLVAHIVKNLPAMGETHVPSLGWEDPPGGGNGYPLQYSCLENSTNRGAWWAIVHGIAKSWT